MLVKRDYVTFYKQTILGPIWFFIQPMLTTLVYVILFGKLAGLSTDGTPQIAFYLAGITIWNYFSESLTKTSTVFKDNAAMMGKVYFPRLIMPLSIVVSALMKFGIKLAIGIHNVRWIIFDDNIVLRFNVINIDGLNRAYTDSRPGFLMPQLDWRYIDNLNF